MVKSSRHWRKLHRMPPPNPTSNSPLTRVVAGVLTDRQGRVLVQRRKGDAHQGGLWEFPGGKCDAGETAEAALKRELAEELDIQVQYARPRIRITHHYPDLSIDLELWQVRRYTGVMRALENQPLRWLLPGELNTVEMPAADRALINAVRLPDVCLITGNEPADQEQFLHRLEHRLEQGIKLVQLRIQRKHLERESIARRAVAMCAAHNAWLILNGTPEHAQAWGAQGVHLNSNALQEYRSRPVPRDVWLSAACHSAVELKQAQALDVDFVLVSPVASTTSHVGVTPIGMEGLRALCQAADRPVYALGGMGPDELNAVRDAGAQGVAGISGFW